MIRRILSIEVENRGEKQTNYWSKSGFSSAGRNNFGEEIFGMLQVLVYLRSVLAVVFLESLSQA